MIPDLLRSLSPSSYPRFADEKPTRTSRYVAFLSIIFLAALGVSIKLRLAPLFTQTFTWLETSMPKIQFANGAVKSEPPGPLRIEHPRIKDFALFIDTTRESPVAASELTDKKVIGVLTARALFLSQVGGGIKTIDFSKTSSDRPFVVDADVYRGIERGFNWVVYPTMLLIVFLSFAASIGMSALMYTLIGTVIASTMNTTLSFGRLFRLAVHAQTAGCLLYSLDAILPFGIPFLPVISFVMSLSFFWIGVRALAQAPAA